MKPYNNHEGRIELKVYENEAEEAVAIAEKIKKLIFREKPVPSKEKAPFAILLRTRSSALIIDELIRRNISFIIKEKAENIYERAGIRHIISYLRIAANGMVNPCVDEWISESSGILNVPNRYIDQDKFEMLLSKGKNFFRDFDLFAGTIGGHLQPQLNDLYKKIMEVKYSIQKQIVLSHIIKQIRDIFGLDKYFLRHDYFGNPDESIIEDMNTLEIISDKFIFPHDLFIHIEDFYKAIEENKNKTPYVIIDTLHGSKGLEYDTVFLPMLNDGYIPHKKNSDIEEERRLFYVGITRAEKNLYMTYSKKLFGKAIEPSRFLEKLEETNHIINTEQQTQTDYNASKGFVSKMKKIIDIIKS